MKNAVISALIIISAFVPIQAARTYTPVLSLQNSGAQYTSNLSA